MVASFQNIVLLTPHSSNIFLRALDEGIVKVYVNEKQARVNVENIPPIDWRELVATLLLHDRILLSEMDYTPEISFPDGSLHMSFSTKPAGVSYLGSLTDPPDHRDWLFPQVIRASSAYSVLQEKNYMGFQLLLDFLRCAAFLSKPVGEGLQKMARDLKGASLDHIDPAGLASSLGAALIVQRLNWIRDNPGDLSALANVFTQWLDTQPDSAPFVNHALGAAQIKKEVGDEKFKFLLGMFEALALRYVPFFRHVIQQADGSNSCILADFNFSAPAASPSLVVSHEREANIINTFRVELGKGERWIPPDMNLRDVLRIRQEPWVAGFRKSVTKVVNAVSNGNKDMAQAARDEFYAAQDRLRAAVGFEKVGSIITYVSLPLSLIEAFLGTSVAGIICSVAGAASLVYSQKFRKQADWVAHLP